MNKNAWKDLDLDLANIKTECPYCGSTEWKHIKRTSWDYAKDCFIVQEADECQNCKEVFNFL